MHNGQLISRLKSPAGFRAGLNLSAFAARLHSTYGNRAGLQAEAVSSGTMTGSYEGASPLLRRDLYL